MRLLPRLRRDVSSLSPGVESLLRGAPRALPPAELKTALLAAFERRQPVRPATRRARFGVPFVASASAAAVLLAGSLLRPPAEASLGWVTMHPANVAAATPVRVVDVEDASLEALGQAGSLLTALPLESP